MATYTSQAVDGALCVVTDNTDNIARVSDGTNGIASNSVYCSNVYNALLNASLTMENRLSDSLKTYQEHSDVQANLQQLQYDLQMWNLALTTMTNMVKNMEDGLNSIVSNLR